MKKGLYILMIMMLVMIMLLIACEPIGMQASDALYAQLMWDESLGDLPYALHFVSNGDGTCTLKSILINPNNDQSFEVEIPEKSPAGDTVVAIAFDQKTVYSANLPVQVPFVICADTFEALRETMIENGISDFDYNQFSAYYLKQSLEGLSDRARLELLEEYPFVAKGDAYVLDSIASADEVMRLCRWYLEYADWNDQKTVQCYNEILASVQQSDELVPTEQYFLSFMDGRLLNRISGVSIPKSVENLDLAWLTACTNLTRVTIADDNEMYRCVDQCIIEKATGTLVAGFQSSKIPQGVTGIGVGAFQDCADLTEICIPDSVTSIGKNAFKGCKSLTSISIPDSVISIGPNAFEGCEGLESVTIGNGVTSIEEGAFQDCHNLSSMAISFSIIESIDWKWFDPYGGRNIPLETISITGGRQIGDKVFANYTNLKNVILSDGITEIGQEAFSGCTGLTSITIPDSVTSIGNKAFVDCSSLTSIIIPDNVIRIGDSTFANCTGLTSITIPDSVTSIGLYTFSGCASLTSLVLPNSIAILENGALMHCNSLASIIIPDSVTSIGEYAFYRCTGLTSITIPDNVISIGSCTFQNCIGLTSVIIGNGVTSIGGYAFFNCAGLTDVYFTGTEEEWAAITVEDGNDVLTTATIHYNYVPGE